MGESMRAVLLCLMGLCLWGCVERDGAQLDVRQDLEAWQETCSFSIAGTWTDQTKGLTWQVASPADYYGWEEAKSYCDSLSLGGHSDWRLPTIGELRTLIRGCPDVEYGGRCNIDEGDCLDGLCRNKFCGGCSNSDGPGEGGMYWPVGIEGPCCAYWSSSSYLNLHPEGDHYRGWYVFFNAGTVFSASVDTEMPVRCVR
jgi:hypothetical protein